MMERFKSGNLTQLHSHQRVRVTTHSFEVVDELSNHTIIASN